MNYNLSSKLFTFGLILLIVSAHGQSVQPQNSADKTHQWEIGLDLLPLIGKNTVPATSLFGRYNFLDKSGSRLAWRIRIGIDTRVFDSIHVAIPRQELSNSVSPYFRPGFEWQREIAENAVLFYGGDMAISYYKNELVHIVNTVPGTLLQGTYQTWEFGLIGFIGFKYRPAPWLSVSIESSLSLTYRIRNDEDKITDINYPNDPGGIATTDVHDFQIGFIPITVLNLSFYLNNRNNEK